MIGLVTVGLLIDLFDPRCAKDARRRALFYISGSHPFIFRQNHLVAERDYSKKLRLFLAPSGLRLRLC